MKVEVRDADTHILAQSRIVDRSDDPRPVLTLASKKGGYRRYEIEVSTTTTDFTFGDHVFYFASGGWDHYLRPLISASVPVRGAFLRVCEEDEETAPAILDLATVGLEFGDRILAYSVGDAALAGPGPEEEASVYAVFSSSDRLLNEDEQHRVPGAIATRLSTQSNSMRCNDTLTVQPDIPEDFRIPNEGVVLDVPFGATHLFLARQSTWYMDNYDLDGDYGVHLVIMRRDYDPEDWGAGQVPPPVSNAGPEVRAVPRVWFEQWRKER